MDILDYVIALTFMGFVLALGMLFARSGSSLKSFFAAGGSVPWWISGLSLYISFFSVGTFVVWGSIAYTDGFVALGIQSTMAMAGLIIGLAIAPAWNRTRAITAAEFITERLGERTQKFYSVIFLLINLFTTGAFLYPVGKIIEVTTGLPLEAAIIALGLCIIAYTATGGLWAVLVTDVLQFVVLSATVVIVVTMSLGMVGGVSGFFERLPEGFTSFHNQEYTWLFLAAYLVYNSVFIGGNWAYVQRYTSVPDPKSARRVGWLFSGLYLVSPVIWMVPPMVYRILEPGLDAESAEGVYLLISMLVVPGGLLGLILAAMVFATASSVSTTLNIAAGVLTHDLFSKVRPHATAANLMRVARLSTLVFGTIAIGIALLVENMGGIVEVVISVAALTGAPIYLPPIWAVFSKRQTGTSILATTCISLLINLYFKFLSPVLFDFGLDRAAEMLVGAFSPLVILTVFEVYYWLARRPNHDYRRYIEFRGRDDTAKAQVDATDSEANVYATKVILSGVLGVGLLILILGLTAETARFITILVALIISTPSAFWLWRSAKRRPVTVQSPSRRV